MPVLYKCFFVFLSGIYTLQAQDLFVDQRDGNAYEIFRLNNHYWFKTNLRFKTSRSWCYENPEAEVCGHGDFYYATDLMNVCPDGWRVPTWPEYRQALKAIEDSMDLLPGTVAYRESAVLYGKLQVSGELVTGITLLGDTTFFDMVANGWVQGKKWRSQKGQTTMWIVEDMAGSLQPHVHVRNGEILKHVHEHHVRDRPRKVRRFSVRCISDTE